MLIYIVTFISKQLFLHFYSSSRYPLYLIFLSGKLQFSESDVLELIFVTMEISVVFDDFLPLLHRTEWLHAASYFYLDINLCRLLWSVKHCQQIEKRLLGSCLNCPSNGLVYTCIYLALCPLRNCKHRSKLSL